jgi:hypothetical protein
MLEFIILAVTTGLVVLGYGMYKISDLLERDLYSLWVSHQEILTILRKIAQRTNISEHDNLD